MRQHAFLQSLALFLLIANYAIADDDAICFGVGQVQLLLDDRPSMKGIFDADAVVFRWVTEQFDSGRQHERIYWDPHEPISGRPAENQPACRFSPTQIRLTKSEAISGRDKWLMLVFELNNIKNADSFEELAERATAGQITRESFAKECVMLEFKAILQTQALYRENPIPGANANSDPYYFRYLSGSTRFDDYLRMLDRRGQNTYDPRDYYGGRFDLLTWWRMLTPVSAND